MNSRIIADIRKELKKNSCAATRISARRFFKEEAKFYGVKSTDIKTIIKKAFKDIKGCSKSEVFGFCEELLGSDYSEEAFIAAELAYRMHKEYEPGDFKTFEHWIEDYANNWAKCDTLCNHAVGAFVERYPEYLRNLKKWTRSKNRWVRRASAVTLIVPARHGKFLKDVFEIADALLMDEDDLVQKGYGWALKAASESHQREVFNYVMKNKNRMPRTALRYAIEKMPSGLKTRAMSKP